MDVDQTAPEIGLSLSGKEPRKLADSTAIDAALAEVRARTRYEGQEPRADEVLAEEVERLRAALLDVDDFEIMLRKLVHRVRQRPDLPTKTMLEQADDLLRRKGRASILRRALGEESGRG